MKFRVLAGFLVCILICINCRSITAYAASAGISFTTDVQEVEAGTEFTVVLEITADTTVGDFEAFFTYDSELAEYSYGPSCITGGDGYLKVSDLGASPSVRLRSYVMTFRALKYGICHFEISGIPVVYEYENGNSMSVMSEPFYLQITAPKNASDNARIDTLRISPGTLTPEFDPEITEYEVELGNDAQRLIVSAVPQDMAASVSISGNENLSYGENNVSIAVTAENGTIKTYHILAIRQQEAVQTPEPTKEPAAEPPEEKPSLFLEHENGTLLCGSYRYRLADLTGIVLPEGYEAGSLLIDGEAVPVYMSSASKEYCLIVLENEAGEKGLYRFDRTEYTIQRYSPDVITIRDSSLESRQLEELLERTKEYEKNKNKMSILTGVLGAAAALFGVLCIRLFLRGRGYDDELD